MASVINSFAINGLDAYFVKIETDTIYGKPTVSIIGLGDTAIKEARERLEASLVSGINIFDFETLNDVLNFLQDSKTYNNTEEFSNEHTIRRKYFAFWFPRLWEIKE